MVDELLIEKVRNHEFLYNTKHKDYRDSNVRQIAWEEIGKELQMPGTVAKKNWDKLRRCFTNARNRHRYGKANGSGAKKKIVWKFKEHMAFLLPFLETRKTSRNLNTTGNESQDDAEDLSDFETPQPDQTTIIPEENDEAAAEKHELESQQTTSVHINGSMEMAQRNKRKASSQNTSTTQNQLVDILKEGAALREKKYKEKPLSQESKCLDGLDEIDMFFLSMSRITKKLPKLEQARIKLQLSNLVLTAEMQDHVEHKRNSLF